jgi:hypothetical protein
MLQSRRGRPFLLTLHALIVFKVHPHAPAPAAGHRVMWRSRHLPTRECGQHTVGAYIVGKKFNWVSETESESLDIQYASIIIPMLHTEVQKPRMRTRSSGQFSGAGQIPATLLSRCSSKYRIGQHGQAAKRHRPRKEIYWHSHRVYINDRLPNVTQHRV